MIKATQHKADRLIERYGVEKALEVVKTEIYALSFQVGVKGCDNRGYWTRVEDLIKKKKSKTPVNNKPDLIQLQSELKDTIFVRPYNIEEIERAAIKLCDAIIELTEL